MDLVYDIWINLLSAKVLLSKQQGKQVASPTIEDFIRQGWVPSTYIICKAQQLGQTFGTFVLLTQL